MLCGVLAAHAGAHAQKRAGDFLAVAMPAATVGVEMLRGEGDGAWQFSESLAASFVATELLKHATHVERPDHSDHLSFPSLHATSTFSVATYVHRRYGAEYALPAYALAVYTGYTRVHAHEHRWADVVGSAGVSAAMSWWLVSPRPDARVVLLPVVDRRYLGVSVMAQW